MLVRLRQSAVIGIVVALIALPLRAHGQFSIEQVMSAPFPSAPVAAGNRVAWVQNDEGVRNIWIAEAPAFQGHQLTTFSEDDGQELSNLQFTPDGSAIVFVRGGAPNGSGEIPNPLSEPQPAERAIWMVALSGGDPVKLATGSSPIVSPDGLGLAFPSRGQVWWVAFDSAGSPTKLFDIRGSAGSLSWSPDGSRLAFVSSRGDHSFIGVYDVASGGLRYYDASVDRDRNPVWSPTGDRIAFLRSPNVRQQLPFVHRRSGEPWSVRVVEVETGRAWEAWRAQEGVGSVFRGVDASSQLYWGSGDHLVFPWERDGWTHLYSVPAVGGEPTLLTPGTFEVEHVTMTPDKREMVFTSNQDDIDRRHIWRVQVSGGRPQAVTSGQGIEWAPAVTEGGAVALIASDARTPARAEILTGSERRYLAPGTIPDDFPSERLVDPQQVIFRAADGMAIHGQLFVPRDRQRGERHPAVMFFHGGSRRQMFLGFHNRGYYHNAYALNQYFASRGYVVLSVNYRSGIGYGMEFREAINYGAHGASEFNDVLGGGLYLQSREDVDPNRIGLWGGSYGGFLTALGLARASDLFAAGVDLHGVHDWNEVIRNFVPAYQAEKRAEVARLAFDSSPMAYVDTWRSPVLLIHGDDDRNVPFSETVDLVEALRARDVYFEQLIFPDEVHGFLLHSNWLAAYEATADFFDRKLKGR
jgi:dipeptidyl aminopeptidase/acylaminoacyl peptidase